MEYINGKIESINQGDHYSNITVLLGDQRRINIKLEKEELKKIDMGKAYQFEVEMKKIVKNDIESDIYVYKNHQPIEHVLGAEELVEAMNAFYAHAPIAPEMIRKGIETYLGKIKNKVLKKITTSIYKENEAHFYIHPAATKFHHAYVGGLSYHTYTMLRLADGFIKVYEYLNADLLYAGIILHDMSKIFEISGVDGEYTKEGLLLGHLVMESIHIDRVATQYGLEHTEEVLLLKHMIISHHGQLNFGSPKKPQTAEALLLWFIDTIDSKFTVLGEVLADTPEGEFTPSVAVLDKMRFYHKKMK